LRITAPSGFSLGIKELWQYRELFYFFTWRDIKVKYKQTALGIGWAILQPLGLILLFSFVFSRNWKIDTGIVHYPVFVLSGLILWNLFSASVSSAGESMILNAPVIKKIYFPRLIIPCSAVLVALFDFLIGAMIFAVFCLVYRQPVHYSAFLYFPAAAFVIIVAAIGAGSFLAALNVKFRDFRYTIPFMLQFLFFASQVIFPLQQIHSTVVRHILSINPVNAAIELMRAPLYGGEIDGNIVLIGTTTSILLAVVGLFYFRKTEAYFADIA